MKKRIVHAKGHVHSTDLPLHITKAHYTFRDRLADAIAKWGGSWEFILFLAICIIVWVAINIYAFVSRWDPYPFIFLNLILALVTVFQAPVILMSQNRQSDIDRLRAEHDFLINKKTEKEVREIQAHLNKIDKTLSLIEKKLK